MKDLFNVCLSACSSRRTSGLRLCLEAVLQLPHPNGKNRSRRRTSLIPTSRLRLFRFGHNRLQKTAEVGLRLVSEHLKWLQDYLIYSDWLFMRFRE